MPKTTLILAIAGCICLGCTEKESPADAPAAGAESDTKTSTEPAEDLRRPGSDRDEHGCIGSAGYQWCERTKQCERPWELAERKDFENSRAAFKAWCSDGQ